MKVDLSSEDEVRRERLLAIYDHVGEIAGKIAQMDDPLPVQLERSVPGYINGLKDHAQKLKNSKCSVVVAGKVEQLLGCRWHHLHRNCIILEQVHPWTLGDKQYQVH